MLCFIVAHDSTAGGHHPVGKLWYTIYVCREKKEDNTESEAFPAVDSSIDVGILKFQPQKIEFKELQAKPEGGDNPNKLISSLTEEEINEVRL